MTHSMQGLHYHDSCRSTAHPEAGKHLARLVPAVVHDYVIAAEGQSVLLDLIQQRRVFLIACGHHTLENDTLSTWLLRLSHPVM